MNVWKFGGSSVKDATALNNVYQIIKDAKNLKFVVISATYNTTNNLEAIASASARGDRSKANQSIEEVISRHNAIADDLNLSVESREKLSELYLEIKNLSHAMELIREKYNKAMDRLYSIGERLSTVLFYDMLKQKGLNIVLLDSRELIKTDDHFNQANPLSNLIEKKAKEILERYPNELILCQGFIGSTLHNETTVLGREGSDYTATLIGAAIEANEVIIWTDVPGVANGDPRWGAPVHFYDTLNTYEASEMAYLGAKVIHKKTLKPVEKKNIPVRVKSTFAPKEPGTLITKQTTTPSMASLSFLKNLRLVTLEKGQSGHLARTREFLGKLDHYGLSPYLVQEMGHDAYYLFENNDKFQLLEIYAARNNDLKITNKLNLLGIVDQHLYQGNKLSKIYSVLGTFQVDIRKSFLTEISLSLLTEQEITSEMLGKIMNEIKS